jgi:hypothetical protein
MERKQRIMAIVEMTISPGMVQDAKEGAAAHTDRTKYAPLNPLV